MTANTFYFYIIANSNLSSSILATQDLTAMQGGLILLIILLIVSACVFAIKFALDIALSRKLSTLNNNTEKNQVQQQKEKIVYAIKNSVQKAPTQRKRITRTLDNGYTLIPEDKLFVLKSGNYGD